MIPTIGRIVLYTLSGLDAQKINKRREDAKQHMLLHQYNSHGTMVHVGNHVREGDQVPMVIVAVWGDTPLAAVNGKCLLDGNDEYWATSVKVGEGAGTYQWPTRAPIEPQPES